MAYTVKYFGIPALAEPIRALLTLSDMEWKDERLTHEAFAPIKPTTKWGQLPVVVTPDGREMTQSNAIVYYFAKMVKVDGHTLYPEDPFFAYQAMEMIGAFEDVRMKLVPTFRIADEAEKEAARAKLFAEDGECTALLAKIEKFAGDKFVVGDRMTVADIVAFCSLNFLRSGVIDGLPKDFLTHYPKLTAITRHVGSLPKLKDYYAKMAAENPAYQCFTE